MQTTLRLGLALLLTAGLPALAADAPRAEKPSVGEIKPGNYFEFTQSSGSMGNCKRWTIKNTDADGMLVLQCDDLLIYQSLANDFNVVKMAKQNGEIQYTFKPFMPTLSFPLEVGKKWSGEYAGFTEDTGDKWTSTVDCQTTAYEKIKVLAGEFDTFRIDCVDHWHAMLLFSGEKTSTRWYSPKLGAVIKVVHEDPKWNYQLAAYKVD